MSLTETLWGSQSWLQPAFSRRLDALESASAGRIACPTTEAPDEHPNPQR
jgi:hypothetical protein